MPGMSDFLAQAATNYMTGQAAMPALGNRFLALFTAPPTSDAGTGGAEVAGGSYARVQIAGSVATNGATAAGNAILHFASVPGWVVPGMSVTDPTTPAAISPGGSVLSTTATTVTMSAPAMAPGVGNGDAVVFSAFAAAAASSGVEPSVSPVSATNTAAVGFAIPTADWGTVGFFGIFDALAAGHYFGGDYLGAFAWLPAGISLSSPGVITAPSHGYSASDIVAITTKFGGVLPGFLQSNLTGMLAVVSPSANTFTVTNAGLAVNTSSVGNFNVRKVQIQTVTSGASPVSFAAGALTANVA